MVEVYNQKAVREGVAERMEARVLDVLTLPQGDVPGDLKDADVVVCSMAYHHIEDIKHTSTVLASLLKKGGHLLVLDLMESIRPGDVQVLIVDDVSDTFHNHGEPKEGHGHEHGHGHAHTPAHAHGHGHGNEEKDGHTKQSVKETIPHIGGMGRELMEETFRATGLLENVSAKPAFTSLKDGTEFTFVLACGTRK